MSTNLLMRAIGTNKSSLIDAVDITPSIGHNLKAGTSVFSLTCQTRDVVFIWSKRILASINQG